MRRRNERKSRPSVLVADCSCPQPRWKDSSGQQRRVKESDSTAAIRKLDAASLASKLAEQLTSINRHGDTGGAEQRGVIWKKIFRLTSPRCSRLPKRRKPELR